VWAFTTASWIQQTDPYASAALLVEFDAAFKDGSSGTTLECPRPGTSPDKGYHWFFLYPSQNQYRDRLGLELGDLYICETNRFGSGCHWYHVYR
jgi:hypothetical protein